MSGRTLFTLAFAALLALAGCTGSDTDASTAEAAPVDMTGWHLASGKAPTKAEFVALSATCQEKGGALEPCLSGLGLKRGP